MISDTGVWGEEEQHAHIFSYEVARFIGKFLHNSPVIYDFGCGKGKYVEYFNELKKPCIGIDGYVNTDIVNISKQDLTIPFIIGAKSDIICLEVWEHIPQEYEAVFIDNLVNNLKGYLILSVALPGQEGLGHVNCQTNQEVIDKLTARGLVFCPELTEQIRQVPENYVAYFRDTLMIFKNDNI